MGRDCRARDYEDLLPHAPLLTTCATDPPMFHCPSVRAGMFAGCNIMNEGCYKEMGEGRLIISRLLGGFPGFVSWQQPASSSAMNRLQISIIVV